MLSLAFAVPAFASTVVGTAVPNLTTAMVKSDKATKVGSVTIGSSTADVFCKSEGKGFTCRAVKADGTTVEAARAAQLVQRKDGFELRVPLAGDLTVTIGGVGASAVKTDCCTIIYGDGTPPETQCPCKV